MGGLSSDHGVMDGGVVGEEHAGGGGGGQGEQGETSEGLTMGGSKCIIFIFFCV